MLKRSGTAERTEPPVELQLAEMAAVIAGAAPRLLDSCAGGGRAMSPSRLGGVDPTGDDTR